MNDTKKKLDAILANNANTPEQTAHQELNNILSNTPQETQQKRVENTNPISSASNAIKDIPVLGNAYRILGHSVIGGIAEPITSIVDLAARPFGHLSKYTTRPILNAEESVNQSLDKDDKGNEINDYGNRTALPSEVGSFAASFVPVVRGAKFLNFLGDTVKRFTNPRLYKTEQAIKNTLGDFKNTVKQSAEQSAQNNVADKAQSLADSINNTTDLQKQLATASAKEPIRKSIKAEQENSQNLLDSAYADSKNIQDLNEKLGNQYSELEKLHKDLKEIKPGISSTMADFLLTGKRGYGIGQGLLVGGINGAAVADQANPQDGAGAQIATGALFGAGLGGALSGAAHGLQTYLMGIGKKAQQTITPNENRVLQAQKQTEPAVSLQHIEDTVHAFPDHEMEDFKNLKQEEPFSNEGNDIEFLKKVNNFLKNMDEKYTKAIDPDSSEHITIDPINSPSPMQKQLGYGLSLTQPESENSYSKQFAKSQAPIFNALNVKDLENVNNYLKGINNIVDQAYKAKKIDEVPLHDDVFNYMMDAVDKNRTKDFEKSLSPVWEQISHSTNAYKALTDAYNLLRQHNFDNLTDLRSSKSYKNLTPYARDRLEHEITTAEQEKQNGKYPMVVDGQEENHQIGLAQRGLQDAIQMFNKNADGKGALTYKAGDNVLNKYHQMQKELNLPFAKDHNGSAIPISKITDIKRLINEKGAYDADPNDKLFYYNHGSSIRDLLNPNQNDVVHAHLYDGKKNIKSEIVNFPITSMMAELHKLKDAGNIGQQYGSDLLGINNFDIHSDPTNKKIAARMNMQSKALGNLIENLNKLPRNNKWGNIVKDNLDTIKTNAQRLGEYSEKGSGNNLDNRASQDQSVTPTLFMNSRMLEQRHDNLEKAKEMARTYTENAKYLSLLNYLAPKSSLKDHVWANINLASQHLHPTVGGVFSHLANSLKKTKDSEAEEMNSNLAHHLSVMGGLNPDIVISNHPENHKLFDGKQARTQYQVAKRDPKTGGKLAKTVSLKDANSQEIFARKLELQKLVNENARDTKNFQNYVKQEQNAQKVDAEAKMKSIEALHKYANHNTKWTPETLSLGATTGFLNGARPFLETKQN